MTELQPVRIFKSDFLESFSHIHPWQVAVFWSLVEVFLVFRTVRTFPANPTNWIYIPLCVIMGGFLWTLAEYSLHRWLFHHEAKTEAGKKVFFMFHGVHHAQPMVKTRLVMPFPVSVPLALIFFGLFRLVCGRLFGQPEGVAPLFAGFVAGYMIYDLGHYAFHHFRLQRGYLAWIRKHHMRHHGSDSHMRFGVSSPLWDYIFGTMPRNNGS